MALFAQYLKIIHYMPLCLGKITDDMTFITPYKELAEKRELKNLVASYRE